MLLHFFFFFNNKICSSLHNLSIIDKKIMYYFFFFLVCFNFLSHVALIMMCTIFHPYTWVNFSIYMCINYQFSIVDTHETCAIDSLWRYLLQSSKKTKKKIVTRVLMNRLFFVFTSKTLHQFSSLDFPQCQLNFNLQFISWKIHQLKCVQTEKKKKTEKKVNLNKQIKT